LKIFGLMSRKRDVPAELPQELAVTARKPARPAACCDHDAEDLAFYHERRQHE
jgi:hypothetical protein